MTPPGWLDAHGRPRVILQLGLREFSVLVWVREEGDRPVYRAVKSGLPTGSKG